MVYRVKAGFVRDRPLTAPDLSMYQRSQKSEERPEMTTKSAYERINHRINSDRAKCKVLYGFFNLKCNFVLINFTILTRVPLY